MRLYYCVSMYFDKVEVCIVGVALTGSSGSPMAAFTDPRSGECFLLAIDPFQAEFIIRDYLGETENTAASWLSDMLRNSSISRAEVEVDDEGLPVINLVFKRSNSSQRHKLSLSDGLALVRRHSLPLYAHSYLFRNSEKDLECLSKKRAFGDQFLYLDPSELAGRFWMD